MNVIEIDCHVKEFNAIQEALIKKAIEQALFYEQQGGMVSVSIVSKEEIHRLNVTYRHIDRPTDVLTFAATEGDSIIGFPDHFLGDIAICYEIAVTQAEEYGHSVERELAFLAVHGTLHLLGYDHLNKEEETIMFQKQESILQEMGLTR